MQPFLEMQIHNAIAGIRAQRKFSSSNKQNDRTNEIADLSS